MHLDNTSLFVRLTRFARISCYLSASIATIVLIGWQFGIPVLRSIVPGLVSMKPLTAVCFIACAASLYLHLVNQQTPNRTHELLARTLPLFPILASLGTFVAIFTHRNLAFEAFLFHSAVLAENSLHPGRMSVATVSAFLALSFSLILFDPRSPRRALYWQPLSLAVIFFSLVQFLGYLYGAHDLYQTFSRNPMALQTAALFLLLGFAIFFVRADFGWMQIFSSPHPGALMARRIILAAIFLPAVLGGLRIYGERRGLYQGEFGVALFTAINIACFATATWFAARSINSYSSSLLDSHRDLQLSEERLRMAISSAGIGLWRLDLTANTFFCSPLFSELCGLPAHGLVPLDTVISAVLPDDIPVIQEALREIHSTGHLRDTEYRVCGPDGSIHWLSSRGKAFCDDSGSYSWVEGMVQEITQRKLAEQQSGLIASIVASSQDAIFTKDLEGIVTSWNPAAQRIYGYLPGEIIGRSIHILATQKRDKEFDGILERVRRGESVHQLETQRQAKDGKIIDISLSVSPLRDSRGKLFGISSIARDITEQHTIEQQLRQAQKMEAVGQLAGGIAHDFNNLIMVINSYAQLIQDGSAPESPFHRYAQQIMNAGNKAATVTRQLLAFSRKQPQDLKLLDLNLLVAQFCKMLPSFIGEEIRFEVRPYPSPVHVHADHGQLEQVLMNLVVNARDAMLPKGGSLTVALDCLDIGIDYRLERGVTVTPGHYCLLSVKDTGTGMTPETKAHIFEPFFTTKVPGKGTGLGLATVYGIIRQHRGTVSVFSEPNAGTEFKIFLPISNQTLIPDARPASESSASEGHETILLVEDEEPLREAIRSYLVSKGYLVLTAQNGDEALRMCRLHSSSIDLLLTDLVMPGMHGTELIHEARLILPRLRTLIMSGYSDRNPEFQMYPESRFLQKPLNLSTLAQQLRQLLDHHPTTTTHP